jgi:hypothetical protein
LSPNYGALVEIALIANGFGYCGGKGKIRINGALPASPAFE